MSQPAEALPAPSLAVREDPAGANAHVPVLVLPAELPFEALRELIDADRATLIAAFDGRSGRVDLGSRAVDLFDLRRLIHHLEDACDCAITGLYATPDAVQRYAERELKLKLFLHGPQAEAEADADLDEDDLDDEDLIPDSLVADVDPIPDVPEARPEVTLDPDALRPAEDAAPPEEGDEPTLAETETDDDVDEDVDNGNRTLQVYRTVRSGSVVSFDGDITVFGDVNPGAMVTASGSIVVMGALKGVAHAGATGDESAFILGLQLQPTQLRIGRRIAIASDDRSDGPELALVRDARIVIEPYRSSSMNRARRGR